MASFNLTRTITGIVSAVASVNPLVASFLIALLSNSIPFMTVPYLVVIAGYGALLDNWLEKLLVGIGGGLGAALGKMIVFYFGREVNRVLSEETRRNLEFFAKAFERGVFIAVFLFAALPLPDDVLYIPLGVAGYSPVLFFAAVALGKTVLTLAAVFFGDVIGQAARGLLGAENSAADSLAAALLLLAGSLLVTYIIIRMDWKKVIEVYNEHGLLAGMLEMIIQAVAAMLPRRYAEALERRTASLIERLGEQRRREASRE